MKNRITIRLKDHQVKRLERELEITQASQSAYIRNLIEEALRSRDFPGIIFIDAPSGRQATIAGTGLAVWEVLETLKSYDGDRNAMLEEYYPQLSERDIRVAMAYARKYREEIERKVRRNEELADEVFNERNDPLFHDPRL